MCGGGGRQIYRERAAGRGGRGPAPVVAKVLAARAWSHAARRVEALLTDAVWARLGRRWAREAPGRWMRAPGWKPPPAPGVAAVWRAPTAHTFWDVVRRGERAVGGYRERGSTAASANVRTAAARSAQQRVSEEWVRDRRSSECQKSGCDSSMSVVWGLLVRKGCTTSATCYSSDGSACCTNAASAAARPAKSLSSRRDTHLERFRGDGASAWASPSAQSDPPRSADCTSAALSAA